MSSICVSFFMFSLVVKLTKSLQKTKDTIKGEVKTSPKKRGADATVEGSPSPQKKRTISKAKNGNEDITLSYRSSS